MVRKSKQASGNAALTHYELRHKLSSDHGTQKLRLAGHAQYQMGSCGLSLTSLVDATTVLCSPSGHLYEDQAILEYLVTQTRHIKEQQEKLEESKLKGNDNSTSEKEMGKRKLAFEASQKDWTKKQRPSPPPSASAESMIAKAKQDLKRTSYWLADSQPVVENPQIEAPVSARPVSPHSQEPLRRKDLWPVQLEFLQSGSDNGKKNDNQGHHNNNPQVICSLTGKPIRTHAAVAYWTSRESPGRVVLKEDGYEQLIVGGAVHKQKKVCDLNVGVGQLSDLNESGKKLLSSPSSALLCPTTNKKIKYTRMLQRSGSSFATSGQDNIVEKYRPTMT